MPDGLDLMSKRKGRRPSKRRLTASEVKAVREWMDSTPQGRKPSIRQIAKAFGRTRPTIIKSLDGWKGIQRGRPESPVKPLIPRVGIGLDTKPGVIEPFTTKTPELNGKV